MLPITLPVTVGLGENATGALNALVPAPASGGGRRPCARGRPIRTSQFPYSTITVRSSPCQFARRSFRVRGYGRRRVLTTVHAIGGVESGASIYVRVLSSCASVRVPLTDTLDNYYYYYVLCVSTLFLCKKAENKYLIIHIYLGLCRILSPI